MAETTDVLMHKAQTYLRSAAVLLELEDYDSCASRAYFAMFYAAQALLVNENGALPEKKGIRSAFVEQFVDGGTLPEQAGNALHYAYELQERGDYSHTFAVEQGEAERVLQEAEAFVTTLETLVDG
ncbi:MAG: HEPN domain-containing protein [Rhodothermales bacterium]|nr:HEPN domain-containing protein [Rhodothermales bacterium]